MKLIIDIPDITYKRTLEKGVKHESYIHCDRCKNR